MVEYSQSKQLPVHSGGPIAPIPRDSSWYIVMRVGRDDLSLEYIVTAAASRNPTFVFFCRNSLIFSN